MSYGDRLRRMVAESDDPDTQSIRFDDIERYTRERLPEVLANMSNDRPRLAPVQIAPLRKRPRSPSPPCEPSQEPSPSQSVGEDTPPRKPRGRPRKQPQQELLPIGNMLTVPHVPTVGEEPKYESLEEAYATVQRLVKFYRDNRARIALLPDEERCFLCEYGNKT
jgi:hypothetical protein